MKRRRINLLPLQREEIIIEKGAEEYEATSIKRRDGFASDCKSQSAGRRKHKSKIRGSASPWQVATSPYPAL